MNELHNLSWMLLGLIVGAVIYYLILLVIAYVKRRKRVKQLRKLLDERTTDQEIKEWFEKEMKEDQL